MKFFAVDVAAEHGGALTVLRAFIEAAARSEDEWVIYVSTPPVTERPNIRFRTFPWVKISWLHRLWFDLVVMPVEAQRQRPDAVLSLQNLAVARWRGPQVVYLHQSLPFSEIRYGLWENPKLWVYQNLISRLIRSSCRRAQRVVVQADWVRGALLSSWPEIDREKVVVYHTDVPPPLDRSMHRAHEPADRSTFFYPANAEPYKNHRVILEACEILEERGLEFQVIFTVNPEQLKVLWKRPLPRAVLLVGRLRPDEVQSEYARSVLLFPSLLESRGLPPLEAVEAGSIVIASDLAHSREVLEGYPNAHFAAPTSAEAWAELMAASITGQLDYVEYDHQATTPGASGFAGVIDLVKTVAVVEGRRTV